MVLSCSCIEHIALRYSLFDISHLTNFLHSTLNEYEQQGRRITALNSMLIPSDPKHVFASDGTYPALLPRSSEELLPNR